MAKISLRAYLREIESLIEKNQIDEALAHCRHILTVFPKNLGSYRLLGKAFLECQRYTDAADIFSRVLSSVPDDFVSHVGMSIIREDEGNLDGAIWHMERAFEVQPYNSAIQDELRRLYGRRDGLEPPKVRLTRGALARMYAKGDLYQQAIGELRSALAEAPQRPDLKVVLARMYYMTGQRVEAVDVCSSLLKKFPYCLEANRIIGAVLPETERKEESLVYQQKVTALDPYLSRVSTKETSTDSVPENAVVLDRLEYEPGATPFEGPSQPAWASSLGVAFHTEDKQDEGLPDWLSPQEGGMPAFIMDDEDRPGGKAKPAFEEFPWNAEEEPQVNIQFDGAVKAEDADWLSSQVADKTASQAEDIPEWMRSAGWTPSQGGPETPVPFEGDLAGEPLTEDGIAMGDIPDWLKAMAPPGAMEEKSMDEADAAPGEPLPWLDEQPGASDTIVTWLSDQKGDSAAPSGVDQAEEDVPDWLMDLDEKPAVQADAAADQEVPDWLQEMPAAASSVQPKESSEAAPDWLQELSAEGGEPAGEDEEDTEDWLKSLEMSVTGSDSAQPEEADLTFDTAADAAASEAELPDWMQELTVDTPGAPPAAEDDTDDWLKSLAIEPAAEPAAEGEPENEAAVAEDIPDWMQELAAEPAGSAAEEDDTDDWLKMLASEGTVEADSETFDTASLPSEETLFDEAVQGESPPDWLLEFGAGPAASGAEEPAAEELQPLEPAAWESEAQAEEVLPEPVEQALAEAAEADLGVAEQAALPGEGVSGVSLEDENAMMAWLENLAAKQGVAEEELLTRPEDRTDLPPDWVQEDILQEAEEEVSETEGEFAAEAALVSEEEAAVEALAQGEAPSAAGDAAAAEEIPDWLREIAPSDMDLMDEAGQPETQEAGDEIPEWLRTVAPEAAEQALEAGEDVSTPVEYEEGAGQAAVEPVEVEAEAGLASVSGMSLEDEDSMMAWLESLAAKQGVAEEELLTRPEDRRETPPDWVQEEAEKDSVDEPAVEEVEAPVIEEETAPAREAAPETLPSWLQGELAEAEVTPEFDMEIPAWIDVTEPEEIEAVYGEETPTLVDFRIIEEPAAETVEQEAALEEVLIDEVPAEEAAVETAVAGAEEAPAAETAGPGSVSGMSLEDEDAMMAWLESLAAKQGVSEEELLTRPEDRTDLPPDWVQDDIQKEATLESQPHEDPVLGDTEPVRITTDSQVEELPATIQMAPVSIEPATAPAEVGEAAFDATEPEAAQLDSVEEEIPAWMLPNEEAGPLPPVEELTGEQPSQAEAEEAAPAWFEATTSTSEAQETDAPGEPELPAWLVETSQPAEEEYAWVPPAVEQEPVEAAAEPAVLEAAVPEPKQVDINAASLVELESLPGVGYRLAQQIVERRSSQGPFTSLDQLAQLPGMDPDRIAELSALVFVPAPLEAGISIEEQAFGSSDAAASPDSERGILTRARTEMIQGKIQETLGLYNELIQKEQLLPEVIKDLQDALYRYPVDVSIWQTLGDAFMSNNQLQEALEAYIKAEELLR